MVKDKIQSALDTQGFKKDSLPKCIILDEIDGASSQGGNFVNTFLNFNIFY
jgi:hypothetical protein